MSNFFVYTLFLFLNFFLLINKNKISKFLNLWDKPDQNLKKHKIIAAPIIGIFFYINLTLLFFLSFLIDDIFLHKYIYLFLSLFFILGIFDDYFSLNYNLKFLFIILFCIFLLKIIPGLLITELRFSFLDRSIYLSNHLYSYAFTIFCLLVFINAFNMYDGINCQSLIYIVIFSIYLISQFEITLLLMVLIIIVFFFLKPNYEGKLFLGNNGTILIGFLISTLSINSYNTHANTEADTIFILMMLPGIDMLRLFITRSVNLQNPFKGDRNHIHHLLIKKFFLFKSNLILFFIILIPIILSFLNNKLNIYIILIYLLIYFCIINILKNK